MSIIIFMLALLASYVCGSLSSAIIVCRLFHLPDPRTQGSGNPGTTNVLRIGGKKLAVLVFLGDSFKGAVPVLLATVFLPASFVGWIGLAAVLGHLYPLFFQGKGGKGVATAAGALLTLSWPLGLAVIATWIFMAIVFRYSSLAALTATIAAPLYSIWLTTMHDRLPIIIICLWILWRHRDNIKRLIAGNETKIGRTK